MRSSLNHRLLEFLERNPTLLPRGARVVVALSGGPDSMALLSLLVDIAAKHPLELSAAHFDHGFRPESAGEARRVASWSARLGVRCTIGRSPSELSPNQAAFRRARYRFLHDEVLGQAADRLATGHQADDQAETVLFRLVRGTGLKGLGGIPLRRGYIVRPLLPFWRREIHAWLTEGGIEHLRDPANEDPRWARSRLRHQVLPALEKLGRGTVRPRLVALAAEARRADRTLDRSAARWLRSARRPDDVSRFQRATLAELDGEMLGRVVRLVAKQHGVALTRGGTEAAVEFIKRGRSGAAIDLSGTLRLGREFDALWFGPAVVTEPDRPVTIDDSTPGESIVTVGGRGYGVVWGTERGRDDLPRGFSGVTLARRELRFPLTVRGPEPGDRIRLHGGTRKLKKLFLERRIPRSERGRIPVLQERGGRILWVAGLAVARETEAGTDDVAFVVRLTGGKASAPDRVAS